MSKKGTKIIQTSFNGKDKVVKDTRTWVEKLADLLKQKQEKGPTC